MLYRIARATKQVCEHLGVSHASVLARANLPENYLDSDKQGVDAVTFFLLWEGLMAEASNPELPLFLGKKRGQQPTSSAVVAFACSKTVRSGLQRIALFHTLFAPIAIEVLESEDDLRIRCLPADLNIATPESHSIFVSVYLVEMLRFYTEANITPLRMSWPSDSMLDEKLSEYFGVKNSPSEYLEIVLSKRDALLPLVIENDSFWRGVEPALYQQMIELKGSESLSGRVECIILEQLPAGVISAELVSERLNMSRRSLQRHLLNEGTSFRHLLDKTRTVAAHHYLLNTATSVEEISFLLGYSSASSFYRAFHKWTKSTPMQVRLNSQQLV